jgi:hypothetical protein
MVMLKQINTHTRVAPPVAFRSRPNQDEKYEDYNQTLEKFLKEAFSSSARIWVAEGEESKLKDETHSKRLEANETLRHLALRLATAVLFLLKRNDNARKWVEYAPDEQRKRLLEAFEYNSLRSTQLGEPEPRLLCPELTLESLLQEQGLGFFDLCMDLSGSSLKKVKTKTATLAIVPNESWERLVGARSGGSATSISKDRLAYVDHLTLLRHVALSGFALTVLIKMVRLLQLPLNQVY